MNNIKHIKPNLIDPILEKKIIKTLNPPKEDYWGPAKNGMQTFYQKYIKPNIILVIIIILIILFLIYRYRSIKKDRKLQQMQQYYQSQPNITNNNTKISKQEIDNYSDLLLTYYNQQKEMMREPTIKSNAKLAYPMYPYIQGSLVPSGSR